MNSSLCRMIARIRCPECREEYLLAFSCKTRELCPSCAAKRSAATAALLAKEVIEEVGHAQWVFVIPKMLRPYFLHHRELLGGLARAAWGTVLLSGFKLNFEKNELASTSLMVGNDRFGLAIFPAEVYNFGQRH